MTDHVNPGGEGDVENEVGETETFSLTNTTSNLIRQLRLSGNETTDLSEEEIAAKVASVIQKYGAPEEGMDAMEVVDRALEGLRIENDRLKEEYRHLVAENERLKTEDEDLVKLRAEVAAMRAENERLKVIKERNLKKKIMLDQELAMTLAIDRRHFRRKVHERATCQSFLWKIDDYTLEVSRAKDKRGHFLSSPEFESWPGGYRLQLRALLDASGRNKVEVSLKILATGDKPLGGGGSSLLWPVRFHFRFALLDEEPPSGGGGGATPWLKSLGSEEIRLKNTRPGDAMHVLRIDHKVIQRRAFNKNDQLLLLCETSKEPFGWSAEKLKQ